MSERDFENELQETVDEATEAQALENGGETQSETTDDLAFFGLDGEAQESEVDEEEQEDVKEVNYGDSETAEVPEASKKTTAVLIGIILVLVAVIVIFAVMIIKQLGNNEESSTGDASVTSAAIQTGEDTSDDTDEVREYNVTCELGQYKGIEVDYECEEVTDVDVAVEIAYFLESLAEAYDVTDRGIEEGDVANIDYTGYIDGELFDGGADTDFDLEIGSDTFIDGFEDALIGAKAGDVVDVNISFPDPYPNNTDLSGQPVLFVVTINYVTEYVTPELTDELIAENTEYETASEYEAAIREELEASAAEDADSEAENAIMEAVIANATFGGEIDEEIEYYTEQYLAYYDSMAAAYYGIDGATLFYYMYGLSSDEYEEMMRENVGFSIKYQYVLDEIAAAEGMTVSEEEYEEQFNYYFIDYYGYTDKEEVLADFTEQYPDEDPQAKIDEMVNESVLRDKAEQFLLDNAVINK